MKIVIGTVEVANIIYTISSELKRQGHEVISICENEHVFYENKYTFSSYDLIFDYYFPKYKSSNSRTILIIKKGVRIIDRVLFRFLRRQTVKKIIKSNDLYIFVWRGLLSNDADLKIWKRYNKKIVTLFMGSEIRDYNTFINDYNINHWKFPNQFLLTQKKTLKEKIKKIRLHEKYSDAIFSVPDQSGLLTKSYYHLQIPVDISKFEFCVSKNEIPLIIHAPSNPLLKGTDIIEKTIKQLQKDGVKFIYKRFSGISHNKIVEFLSKADILIDQILLHGPGVIGFEAMASGCVVATKFIENSPTCFQPPVYKIDADNIYIKLKELIENKELRIKLAKEGRKYVLKNNYTEKVVLDILERVNLKKEFDYIIQ